jgi:hypothetical protein
MELLTITAVRTSDPTYFLIHFHKQIFPLPLASGESHGDADLPNLNSCRITLSWNNVVLILLKSDVEVIFASNAPIFRTSCYILPRPTQ